jgi:hypothetical protein
MKRFSFESEKYPLFCQVDSNGKYADEYDFFINRG